MKKTAAIILTAFMLLAISGSALAGNSSVQAPIVNPEITADLPEIMEGDLEVKTLDELTVEQQETVEAAIEALAEILPEGVTVRYCNYVSAESYPASVTIRLENAENVTAMLFVDGEWIEVEVIENPDGTFTITVENEGVLAIFTDTKK